MMESFAKLTSVLLLGSASCALASPAAAQQANAAEEVQPESAQDIVVTAQRRAELLRDVPMSITALNEESLVKAGISQTADLARVTPGLIMPYFGGGVQPSIRGVSSQGASSGDAPNVAIYIDGVYQSNPFGNIFDLADVQQIEVLKGPQGTLYGQNATGGAIIIRTLQPSFTWKGLVRASYGNYNDVLANGYITGPIAEGVAFSLSGIYQNRDGFRRHVISGQRDKGLESRLVRGKLLIEPSDGFQITLAGYYSRRADSAAYAGFTYLGNSVGKSLVAGGFPRITSADQFEADPDVNAIVKGWGGSLHLDIETGLGQISTVTSKSINRYLFNADVDYSPVRYAFTRAPSGDFTLSRASTFVQEVNFASRDFGNLSLTTGLFYLHDVGGQDPNYFALRAPVLVPNPIGAPVFFQHSTSPVEKTIWAGYLEFNYRLGDALTLTAGGRYSSEHQIGRRTNIAGFAPPLGVKFVFDDKTFKKFVPRLTARYALSPRDNVYASVSRGFKSGVVQSTAPAAEPEVLTAYELGYKGRPVDGLEFNVAAYYYDYKDLQVFRYLLNQSIIANAAKARIKGIDFDAVVSLSRDLSLTFGGSFLDGKYRSFPDAAIFVTLPTGGNATVSQDISGQRISRAPKFSGNAALNYKHETQAGEFGAYAAVYHSSRYKMELSGKIPQRAYTTIDAELSFAPASLPGLRVIGWGRNLTDKAYLASALPSALADGASYAQPRTYGLRLEYRF